MVQRKSRRRLPWSLVVDERDPDLRNVLQDVYLFPRVLLPLSARPTTCRSLWLRWPGVGV